MTCDEFMDAVLEPKGPVSKEEKAAQDEHAAGCKECAELAQALPEAEAFLGGIPREVPLPEATQKKILDDMHAYLREERAARALGRRRTVLLVLAVLAALALGFMLGRLTAPRPAETVPARAPDREPVVLGK